MTDKESFAAALNAAAGRRDELLKRLPAAFEQFQRSAGDAERAFNRLAERVVQLQDELDGANRKLQEKVAELERLSGHLVSLLESLTDGVVAVDREERIRVFNPSAERLSGWSAGDLLGQPLSVWLADGTSARELVRGVLRETCERTPTMRVELPRPSGELLPAAVAAATVIEPGTDRRLGAVLVMQNLQEVEGLREQIRRTAGLAAVGRIAAVVAHEIRNPLGGIEGFASLLEQDLRDDPNRRRMAAQIVTGVRDLNRLVGGLLEYARPPELRLEPLSLTALLEELGGLTFAEPATRAAGLRWSLIPAADCTDATLVADRGALRQIFLNLFRNAVEAMRPLGRGTLTVRVNRDQIEGRRAVRIEVDDEGPGLSPKDREKLFQPFVTTKSEGTGLGLSTAAKLVEAHGGEIFCADPPQDSGARFVIRLPLGPG
jgi:PAS domain S-box-containing protein